MSDLPVVLEATTTQQAIAIDPLRWHHVQHCGEDTAGAAAAQTILCTVERNSESLTVDDDASEGANKMKLLDKKDYYLPPGIGSIAFQTASGAPTFQIIPLARDPFA